MESLGSDEDGLGLTRVRMHAVILIDGDEKHAEALADRLRARSLDVIRHVKSNTALSMLKRRGTPCDLVLINVSDSSRPWLRILRELQEACFSFSHCHPLVLCLSTVKREPQFELQIERLGARFVYER
jgi:DNA-binding NarL/FixJ family response regulator